jgi:ATP-binding cassette subfamily B (MDR/TAP) protein 1
LERFYDPTTGTILLDGVDTKTLNVQWLRHRIAMVPQQPMLFPTSVFENIAAGLSDRASMDTSAVVAAVHKAAKEGNAHEFISQFPKGYETDVGDAGAQLSGGQKQRIAIARALIDNPQILLLDEATSALDSRSEKVVQAALERLQSESSRTTITIAHRLSTIRKCDQIIVLGTGGKLVEHGTYDSLLAEGGTFAAMHAAQQTERRESTFSASATGPTEGMDDASAILTENTSNSVLSGRYPAAASVSASATFVPGAVPVAGLSIKKSADGATSSNVMDSTSAVVKAGDATDDAEAEEEEEVVIPGLFKWAVMQSRPEWVHIVFGLLGSIAEGFMWPVYSLLLTQVIAEVVTFNDEAVVKRYCIYFVIVSVSAFFALYTKMSLLGIAGTVRVFWQQFTLEDAIRSHACSLKRTCV